MPYRFELSTVSCTAVKISSLTGGSPELVVPHLGLRIIRVRVETDRQGFTHACLLAPTAGGDNCRGGPNRQTMTNAEPRLSWQLACLHRECSPDRVCIRSLAHREAVLYQIRLVGVFDSDTTLIGTGNAPICSISHNFSPSLCCCAFCCSGIKVEICLHIQLLV